MDENKEMLQPRQPEQEPETTPTEKKKERRNPLYELYILLHDLVYILAAVTLIFVFCVRIVGVSGDSMYPTLHDRDFLVLESNVLMRELERGDIIVARKTSFREGGPIVKRVIAVEGETLRIDYDESGAIVVMVNGQTLDEPYINEAMIALYPVPMEITVETDCVFAMGDNRNHSSDSRLSEIGQIHESEILGKVLINILPAADEEDGGFLDFDRFGTVS